MKRLSSTVLALVALGVAPLSAGVVFEVETTYHSGSDRGPESSEMSVEEPNLKMEVRSSEDAAAGARKDEAIYRGDRREMVIVDHAKKVYVVIDEQGVADLAGQVGDQVSQAMKEVEKQLEKIDDPALRKRMEEMLKATGGSPAAPTRRPTTEYRRSGEKGTRAGHPCVRWDVFEDGEKIRELWVTDWNNVEGGDEVRGTFEDMAKFWAAVMRAMQEAGGLFGAAENPADAFTRVDGFPVVTRSFEAGELEEETTLRSARRRTLDPAEFEPPAGYKRRSMLGSP